MFKTFEVKTFKFIAEIQVNHILGGVMYFVTEGNKVIWNVSSDGFKIKPLEIGQALPNDSSFLKAIHERKIISFKLPRSVYGTRILAISTPIEDESGSIVGVATIVYPLLHPLIAAFDKFAPILSQMFPEGVFLYTTDLKKILTRQPSVKFDIPNVLVGYELKETDIASITIKSRHLEIQEVDASRYGVPVIVMNYPVFDEENAEVVVGTFGIVIPKSAAVQLREMSSNLDSGLSNISATIQELTASATQIHVNSQELDRDINEISNLSDKINEISNFIKSVSDATNMLGLNASIEAARAGEFGRGFSVVANEIRKLSEQSKSTVPKIKELTDNIKDKVSIASKKSNVAMGASQEQAAATEEITASLEEITSLAVNLNKISQNV